MDDNQSTSLKIQSRPTIVPGESDSAEGSLATEIGKLKKQIQDLLGEMTAEEQRNKGSVITIADKPKTRSVQTHRSFAIPENWEPPKGILSREIWELKKQIPDWLKDMMLEGIREEWRTKKGKEVEF